jgi:glycosyltransferase involved in cell wall biosynthesis
LSEMYATIRALDPHEEFLSYRGAASYENLPGVYQDADAVVFASTCENMPNTLVEAMASGSAIACSSRSVMPEILADAGVYFDPDSPASIATAMAAIMVDEQARNGMKQRAFERAKAYSWERCARETYSYLVSAAHTHADRSPSSKSRSGQSIKAVHG